MFLKKIVWLLLLCMVIPVFAEEKSVENPDIDYPEKRRALQAWEYVVNTPGYLALLPFWALDYALVPVSYAITETKIIEKTVDLLTSDDGKRGVIPTYEARTGAGLVYYHKDLLTKGLETNLIATAWSGGRQSAQLLMRNINMPGPVFSTISLQYFNFTDEPFFGIGNDIPYDNEAEYEHEQLHGSIAFALPVNSYNSFSSSFGIEQNKVSEYHSDENLSLSEAIAGYSGSLINATGLYDEVKLAFAELQYQHDSRDAIGNPSKGWELLLKGALYKQTDGGRYGFYQGSLDVSKYVHLFYNRVLVFRAAGQITTSYDNGHIPFYYLSELGRRETIRGYERGRFREKDKVLASVEYRFPILKRYRPGREAGSIDMVLFADTGKVSPDITDNYSDNLHYTYGFGFRIYTSKALMMQFYSGYSDDGVRMYFVLN